MSLTVILFAVVFGVTIAGVICSELLFRGRPAWQDFACRVTLATTLILPIALLVAMAWIPNGLVGLPLLKASENDHIGRNVVTEFDRSNEVALANQTRQDVNVAGANRDAGNVLASDAETTSDPVKAKHTSDYSTEPGPSIDGAIVIHGIDSGLSKSGTELNGQDSHSPGSILTWLPAVILVVWGTGSALILLCFVVAAVGIQRVKRTSVVIQDARWCDTFRKLAQASAVGQRLELASSRNVSTPMVVGCWRQCILVPDSMVSNTNGQSDFDQTEIMAVLSHELSHVQRRDTTWNLLSCLSLILWWPVPALHVIRRRTAWVRELLCDAKAVRQIGAIDYAETLLKLTCIRTRGWHGAFAVSMKPSPKSLEARIGWILNRSAVLIGGPGSTAWKTAWLCLTVLMSLVATFRLVPNEIRSSSKNELQEQSRQEKVVPNSNAVIGTVLKEGKHPVANAEVYIVPYPGQSWSLPVDFTTVNSDPDGRFNFPDLEDGKYMLWAEGEGLTSLESFLKGEWITVGKDMDSEPVELVLNAGCNYQVSVVSATDKTPIENAEVSFGWTDTGRRCSTDTGGIARFDGLAMNNWYFVVRADGFATTFRKTAIQELGTTTKIEFEMEPGASIKGTLSDQFGDHVSDVTVFCQTTELAMAPGFAEVKTNMAGEFEIHGLPFNSGLYISSSPEGYERVRHETTITKAGTEFDLVLQKLPYGGDAVIRVLGKDGRPVVGAELFNRGSSSGDVRRATTDQNGNARLDNMFNYQGEYNVVVRAKGKIPTIIQVKPGTEEQPAEETVVLKSGKTLRGQVVTPEGKPAPNVSVFLYETNRIDWSGTDLKWPRVRTDAEGKFEVNEMEGNTRITVYTPREYAPIQSFPVELDGDETQITIEMKPAAKIRVRAVDSETGERIPEFNVKLGRCDEIDRLDGDIQSPGIETSLINPGTNVHGTKTEFELPGQMPGVVYSMTVSAEGYEILEVPRVRAELDAELLDLKLVRKR